MQQSKRVRGSTPKPKQQGREKGLRSWLLASKLIVSSVPNWSSLLQKEGCCPLNCNRRGQHNNRQCLSKKLKRLSSTSLSQLALFHSSSTSSLICKTLDGQQALQQSRLRDLIPHVLHAYPALLPLHGHSHARIQRGSHLLTPRQ